jgi:hypothetical protein
MLGFILSKMQMMLFATGIFVVAMLFLTFVSDIQLKTVVFNSLETHSTLINQQLSDISLCSFESTAISEKIVYGFGLTQIPYDLKFSKESIGEKNILILSINEHGRTNIIDATKIETSANIILIDPGFIAEDEKINETYYDPDSGSIVLYPRAAKSGVQLSPPNSFVALKKVENSEATIYIIPCSTLRKEIPNNCIQNISRVGCYELSKLANKDDSTPIGACFDVSKISQSGVEKGGITWKNCKELGYAS